VVDTVFWFGHTSVKGDFNGDGRSDAIMAYTGREGEVALPEDNVYINPDGGGGYIWSPDPMTIPFGRDIRSLFGPFTGDLVDRAVEDDPNLVYGYPWTTYQESNPPETHRARYAHLASDLNGDRISDLVTAYRGFLGTRIDFSLLNALGEFKDPNGRSAVNEDLSSIYYMDSGNGFVPWDDGIYGIWQHALTADLNGDGLGDLIMLRSTAKGVRVSYALGHAATGLRMLAPGHPDFRGHSGHACQGNECPDFYGVPLIDDFDGDGKQDLVMVPTRSDPNLEPGRLLYAFSKDQPLPDLMKSVKNGFGGKVDISYTPAADAGLAISPREQACGISAPLLSSEETSHGGHKLCGTADTKPRQLVTRVQRIQARGLVHTTHYQYENGRDFRGKVDQRVSLGFEKIRSYVSEDETSVELKFHQDQPYQGRIYSRTESVDEIPVLTEKKAYRADTGWGSTLAALPVHELPPAHIPTFVHEVETTTAQLEEERITTIREIRREYDSLHSLSSVEDCVDAKLVGDCVETRQRFTHDLASWSLARPDARWVRQGRFMVSMERYTYNLNAHREIIKREQRLFDDATRAECSGDPRFNEENWCPPTNGWRWVVVSQNHVYDAFGNLSQIEDAAGNRTTTSVDADYKTFVFETTNALGHRRRQAVDHAGRVTFSTDVENAVETETKYDGFGRTISVSLPFPVTATRPMNPPLREEYAYLLWGTSPDPASKPRERRTQHVRITTWSEPSKSRFREEYFDSTGDVWATVETGNGQGEICTHRGEEVVWGGRRVTYAQPYSAYDSSRIMMVVEFDSRGRPISATRFLEHNDLTRTNLVYLLAFEYAAEIAGIEVTVQNANGETTHTKKDGRGRTVWHTDANLNTTNYDYDSAGRIRRVTLPSAGALVHTYDTLGRLRIEVDPVSGTRTLEYFDTGDLLSERDATGQIKSQSYDPLKRVAIGFNGIGRILISTHVYSYDSLPAANPQPAFSVGRLVRVVDPSGTTDFSYTLEGLLSRKTMSINGLDPKTIVYTHNFDEKVLAKTLPNGTVVSREYNEDGSTATVATPQIRASFAEYNARKQVGLREIFTAANNPIWSLKARTTYTYDAVYNGGHLATLVSEDWIERPLQDYEYQYDRVGNVVRLLDRRSDTDKRVGGVNTDETQGFHYDGTDRLMQATSNNTYGVLDFDYDPIGNLKKKSGVDFSYNPVGCPNARRCISGTRGTTFVFLAVHDAAGRRISLSEDRDGDGLRTEWSYLYDMQGRLRAVLRGGAQVLSMKYNYRGDRTQKTFFHAPGSSTSPTTTTYSLDREFEIRVSSTSPGQQAETIYLVGPDGMQFATHTLGGTLAGQPTRAAVSAARSHPLSGTTSHGVPAGIWINLSNHLGSTSVVLDIGVGEVTRYLTTPHGEVLRTSTFGSLGFDISTRKFTGQEHDIESTLTYFGARYYDELTGRFTTADSVIPGGMYNPQGFNRYAYAYNNPVKYVDPSGRAPVLLVVVAVLEAAETAADGVGAASSWYNVSQGQYWEIFPAIASTVDFLILAPLPLGDAAQAYSYSRGYKDAQLAKLSNWRKSLDGEFNPAKKLGEVAQTARGKYRGGRHGDTKKPSGDGLDSHHMPARSASPLPADDGPAIQMEPADHQRTSSFGSSAAAVEYREKLRRLIEAGKFEEAFETEAADIRRIFGDKYDEAIEEARCVVPAKGEY
jgi:RHS repeat-associated protein